MQRVYSVADHGGLTVIEIENDSPLPIAVAFTNGNLLSHAACHPRRLLELTLPAESVAFPDRAPRNADGGDPACGDGCVGRLPGGLPTAEAVARGWLARSTRAGRLVTPDAELNERMVAERCETGIAAGPSNRRRSIRSVYVLYVDQLVRMGEDAASFRCRELAVRSKWLPKMRSTSRSLPRRWVLATAFAAADRVLRRGR